MRSPLSPNLKSALTLLLLPLPLLISQISASNTLSALAQSIAPESSAHSAEPILQVQGALELGDAVLPEDESFYDEYTFEGRAGQVIVITLESLEFDTYLLLQDDKGRVLAQNDDYEDGNFNSVVTLALPEDGTYTIVANSYDASEQGRYTLTVFPGEIPVFSELTLRQIEANRLNQEGLQQLNIGQVQSALQFFEQALIIFREVSDRAGEGSTLNNTGLAYYRLAQYSQALDYYEQALSIRREIDDCIGEGITLSNIGGTYDNLGQYLQALNYYRQALTISRDVGEPVFEGRTLNNIGETYRNLGQDLQALDYYQQALTISRDFGDRAGEGITLSNIGATYSYLGNYSQALNYQQQALAIHRDIGNHESEGATLNNIGLTYDYLGQYSQALNYYQQALVIRREIGDRAGEGVTLSNIGAIYDGLEQFSQALTYFQQALDISREIGDRAGEGITLSNIGATYDKLEQYSQALNYHQQALIVQRDIDDRAGEGTTLNNIGLTHGNLEQYSQALDYFQQALTIIKEVGNRAGEGAILLNTGVMYSRLEQFPTATNYFLASIETYESLRAADLSDINKITFFDTYLGSYLGLQRSLIAQNEIERALEYAERGRARAFVDLLTSRVLTSGNVDASILGSTNTIDLVDIQRVAREQNATLVQYSVLPHEFLYIWVIQPTGEIAFQQVDLATLDRSIGELVTTSRDAIGVRGRDPRTLTVSLTPEEEQQRQAAQQQQLQQLYQLLIEPIAQHLPTDPEQRIIFIPHQDLFLVPFAALTNAEGQYLIENHTILTAPSVQVLDLTRQQHLANGNSPSQSENSLVVGNPTMPQVWNLQINQMEQLSNLAGAENEAIAIAQALNTEALLQGNADKATVVQQMPDAQIIHLATHGLLEYGNPQDSGVLDVPGAIALAPSANDSGLLTAAEILQMNLSAELVVLSACDTGQGRVTGDGVVGLSRAFVTAGVPSIIVSLWAVDDAATAELMVEFYDQWRQTGDKAQALRQAMLTTMQNHPDPRLWAAFTLIGEAE